MKKTKLTRSLLAACSVVALSVALSGCLHSGGGGPTYSELDLMGYDTAEGASVEAGTYSTDDLPSGLVSALEGYTGPTSAGPGESLTIGDYTFTCGADSSCSVTVAPDGSHFTVAGTVNVMVVMMPPAPIDTDGDGVADEDDAFPNDPNETADSDGDGTGDNADAFPNDPAEMADSDGDGTGDNADAFPNDATETADSDDDGVGDNTDAFPNDPDETVDADGDGIGDNADPHIVADDRDNDGTPDAYDDFPDDATETRDSDGDGVGDKADAFPLDPDETSDSDGDGVGDNEQAEAARVAGIAAVSAEAKTKLDAINAENGQATDAGLGGDGITIGEADGNYQHTVERDRDGTTVKVIVHGATDDDDEEFVLADMDVGPGNSMLTRTMDADDDGNVVTEVAFVSTDIEAPKATAFEKVDGQALDRTATGGTTEADDDPFVALAVTAGTDGVNLPKIMSGSFTAGTGATLTFDADDSTTANANESFSTAGTYNGAMGTYTCSGTTDCTVVLNADGEITAVTGSWIFTPAEGVTSDVPDAAFLSYGFWLKKTADADGVVTYNEVETFATAHGMEASSGTITGSASYKGGATGVYVHNDLSGGGGMVEARTAGHFTADASLTATFGQVPVSDTDTTGTIAPNLLNSVTGTIGNFMLSGGEAQDWSVTLEGPVDITATNDVTGTADGGGAGGSFTADFHGEAHMLPGAVTGEFNANFSNGSVAGAFGAEKE